MARNKYDHKKKRKKRNKKAVVFPFSSLAQHFHTIKTLNYQGFPLLNTSERTMKYRMFSRLWQGNDHKTFEIYRKKWCYILLLHQTTTHTYCHTTTSPHHFQRAQSKNVGERHASDKNTPKIDQNSY